MINRKIAFIGAGKMGAALIEGLLKKKIFVKKNILISDKDENRKKYFQSLGISQTGNKECVNRSEIIFLAVKPNQIEFVCKEIQPYLTRKHIIISIAAGVNIKKLGQYLKEKVQIVRIMPNTPALVGEGMSVYCYNKQFDKKNDEIINTILKAVGSVLYLEEKYFDAVTGLSGSGPAYIFLVINSLAEGGVKMGLPEKVALDLATQTVLGSAEMVKKTNKHPEDLMDMVASPGGTTVEGLKVLEDYKIRSAFIQAVEAATLKSRNLMK